MDSIYTKITSAPQMTKWLNLNFDDINGAGNTATFLRTLYIPRKAKLARLQINANAQFTGNSTAITMKINHPAGISQVDSSAVSAADIHANFNVHSITKSCVSKPLGMVMPPLVNDTSTLANSNVDSYSTSGEYDVVPVVATIGVSSGVPTAGDLHFWLEYVFDANIVWNQDTLS